jgi:uncharacterized RDD family membrane protein YckC
MRCPHCGYNSFAHLENCKKCGRELQCATQRVADPDETEASPQISASGILKAHTDHVTGKGQPDSSRGEQHAFFLFADLEWEGATVSEIPQSQRVPEQEPEQSRGQKHATAIKTPASVEDEPEIKSTPPPLFLQMHADQKSAGINPAGDFASGQVSPGDIALPETGLMWRRFTASILDIAVILTVWMLFYVVGHRMLWAERPGFFSPLLDNPDVRGGYYLLLVFFGLAYFILFHYLYSQTPGKAVNKIEVVACDGRPLTLSQILLRTCGGFISALCLGAGYFAICFASDRRGWNDKLAHTVVVPVDSDQDGDICDSVLAGDFPLE